MKDCDGTLERIRQRLQPLACCFEAQKKPLYFVGGAVRNDLLGLPLSDIDMAGAALPQQAVSYARQAGAQAFVRDEQLGTVEIHLDDVVVEYTPFRTESYADGGAHRPEKIAFTADLQKDALRRDFTVNALYRRAWDGALVDPCGGEAHLRAGLLATPKKARETIADDGLRLLRMIRFACELNFCIADELRKTAISNMPLLADISWERRRVELEKILLSDAKYPQLVGGGTSPVLRGLLLLHRWGALAYLLPELCEGDGVEQPGPYHRYDVLNHGLHACACAPPCRTLRLAALLHDVGKPKVWRETGRMVGHDKVGAELAQNALERMRFENREVRAVCALIERHMFDLDGKAKETTCRKRFAQWGYAFTSQLCALRRADVQGSGMNTPDNTAEKWRSICEKMQSQGAVDEMRKLAIDGREVMRVTGLSPGPQVGEILHRLFVEQAVQPACNTPERMRAKAMALGKEIAARGESGGRLHW